MILLLELLGIWVLLGIAAVGVLNLAKYYVINHN